MDRIIIIIIIEFLIKLEMLKERNLGIDSTPGGTDSMESIPGLLKMFTTSDSLSD
jgi:hypothetical protein